MCTHHLHLVIILACVHTSLFMLIHVGIGSYFGWHLSKPSVHGATQKLVGVDTQSSKSFLFREKRTFFLFRPSSSCQNCQKLLGLQQEITLGMCTYIGIVQLRDVTLESHLCSIFIYNVMQWKGSLLVPHNCSL